MSADVLREHIQKCKAATTKPFGVNVPLMYPGVDKQIDVRLYVRFNSDFTTNNVFWMYHKKGRWSQTVCSIINYYIPGVSGSIWLQLMILF